ncbi:response regulator [Sphingomonas sanguinis]|uniref:Response regulator n=1 Tax=Sphingomonas sanguinis TaxID=33051 RepID=A0ABU5LPN8_9SPHN|nr:response regulator [Sphingomonas sanguinis]MDZ7281898.1 response regulator [Sphingomonas sanguinis]QXT35476.1 response regulator [Sphingomonas sanguinis]
MKRPTVLIVEDQQLLLMHVQFAFEDAGYVVVQADSADEALLALERHPEIRAIFTDVAMPGSIDGATLAAKVRQSHPHVSIIVTSGEQLHVAAELPQGVRFVPKPYTGHDIIRMIGESVA